MLTVEDAPAVTVILQRQRRPVRAGQPVRPPSLPGRQHAAADAVELRMTVERVMIVDTQSGATSTSSSVNATIGARALREPGVPRVRQPLPRSRESRGRADRRAPARNAAVPSRAVVVDDEHFVRARDRRPGAAARRCARRSRSTRLYVGRMTLSIGWRIGPSPSMRRVEIPAHRFPGFDVEHPRAVPPVDRARAVAIADRRADGVDARLQAERLAEEFEPAPPGSGRRSRS